MITFDLENMNAVQLAKLYKLLIALHYLDDADTVYRAGVAKCGDQAFCTKVAQS